MHACNQSKDIPFCYYCYLQNIDFKMKWGISQAENCLKRGTTINPGCQQPAVK